MEFDRKKQNILEHAIFTFMVVVYVIVFGCYEITRRCCVSVKRLFVSSK